MSAGSNLNKAYWDSRWKDGQTGWDLGTVSPPIKDFIDRIADKNLSILIPGCGNAWEAEYLFSAGFKDITLLDISSDAVKILQNRFAGFPEIKLVREDFFQHQGKYELILEQTFFCAISPHLRPSYVLKMKDLLSENGILAGLLFDVDFDFEGPPFGGNALEYRALFQLEFEIISLEKTPLSHPKRLGNEVFIEMKPR